MYICIRVFLCSTLKSSNMSSSPEAKTAIARDKKKVGYQI